MKNIAIFASGGGSNFKSIHHYVQLGEIPGQIVLTVSNNIDSGAIEYAKEYNISTFIINKVSYLNPTDSEELLIQTLIENDVDLICLAGYMKLLPKSIIHQYQNCILNVHPALLPKFGGKGFYGRKVHEAVIASGAEESGVTVHFVDEGVDTGPIIAQVPVPVFDDDNESSLHQRIQTEEHKIYPQVVKWFAANLIHVDNRRVIIKPE